MTREHGGGEVRKRRAGEAPDGRDYRCLRHELPENVPFPSADGQPEANLLSAAADGD